MIRLDESRESASVSMEPLEKAVDKTSQAQRARLYRAVDRVAFVKHGAKFVHAPSARLQNSLLGAVGFLELANAGDFAANVWNDVPVPTFAVVLMAIGGTFALIMAVFAFQDARLSWPNLQVLREERCALRKQKAESLKEAQPVLALDALLDVTFRELGTEVISRFGMDIMLGSGAIVIAAGTFLAIGGADRKVWFASNLLSGYVGNAPIALYGLLNASWAVYIWCKASRHRAAVLAEFKPSGGPVATMVKRRAMCVQLSVAASGMTSVLGGAGSLMSATLWQGYIILIPVIVSSIMGNLWWRHRVGYDRPCLGDTLSISKTSLIDEIQHVKRAQEAFKLDPEAALGKFVTDGESLAALLKFLVDVNLFEAFCVMLMKDEQLSVALAPRGGSEIMIDSTAIMTKDEMNSVRLRKIAKKCAGDGALRHFQSRERHLAEVAMSYMYFSSSAGRK